MMDDLISKKSLLYAYDEKHKGPAGGARKLIEDAPSIPAVPLDKLCEWLTSNFAEPPCCVLENVQCKMECRGFTQMDYSECWRYVLTKWMEGLDALN